MAAKTWLPEIAFVFACAFPLAGCENLSFEQLVKPGGLSGLPSQLAAQQGKARENPPAPSVRVHAMRDPRLTKDVAATLEFQGRDKNFPVVRENAMGWLQETGTFQGGRLVDRDLRDFASSNFREPAVGERPLVVLAAEIDDVDIRQSMVGDDISTTLCVKFEMAKEDGAGRGLSWKITASATAKGTDAVGVPVSFRNALRDVMADFRKRWEDDGAAERIAGWACETAPAAADAAEPPALQSLVFKKNGNAQLGRCTVVCNGYEGFRTMHWANANIFEACKTKFPGIDSERLRVLHDEDRYDDESKVWTIDFRAFARAEKVLLFDKATGVGEIIGDLGLLEMDAEEASEVLKDFVLKAMESHAGAVTSSRKKVEALVRFDDFTTDPNYNLVTIRFRLVK